MLSGHHRLPPAEGEGPPRSAPAEVRGYLGRGGEDSGAELCSQVWHEPPERAFGDGCGVLLVAETDAGCLLGASGARRRQGSSGSLEAAVIGLLFWSLGRLPIRWESDRPAARPCPFLPAGAGLGERGVTAEAVGSAAGRELAEALASGACVDGHLEDQIIIFMALAAGRSAVLTREPSLHTRTAIAVAEQLTAARFVVSERGTGLWLVECEGAAVAAPG